MVILFPAKWKLTKNYTICEYVNDGKCILIKKNTETAPTRVYVIP